MNKWRLNTLPVPSTHEWLLLILLLRPILLLWLILLLRLLWLLILLWLLRLLRLTACSAVLTR